MEKYMIEDMKHEREDILEREMREEEEREKGPYFNRQGKPIRSIGRGQKELFRGTKVRKGKPLKGE